MNKGVKHLEIMKKETKLNIRNIIAFIQGHFRYRIYYSKFAFLIRTHIKEQIELRISSMKTECFMKGQCVKCGCQTTHLQMSNKSCEGVCYPRMLSKNLWSRLKEGYMVLSEGYLWYIDNNKFKKTSGKKFEDGKK